MRTVSTVAALRAALAEARQSGRLGFVPTMGALHAGHAALFSQARVDCQHVVASIFVNPTQFNNPADLEAYPRQPDADARIAADAGVDTLFVPSVEEVFAAGHATFVSVRGAALGLEGGRRPGHFDGVALVCLKLFAMTQPHRAYFGQKDAQQVAVLQQLVRDLNLDLDICVGPTVRDHDGLALSSRNARLAPAERALALAIPAAIEAGLRAYERGEDPVDAAAGKLRDLEVEYIDLARFGDGPTLVVAARVGATRLIDNVPLDHPERAGLVRAKPSGSSQP
jgi:pantoate--beta-alanine ligase